MNDRIIDLHVHIYPDKIARRASASIGDFYDTPVRHDGSIDTLLSLMQAAGVSLSVVHSVAVTPERVTTVNDFIARSAAEHPDKLVGFATLHPDMSDPAGELARALSMGLRGVKIHNDMQRVALDDPRMEKIFDACEGVCPLLLHAGDLRYHYDNPSQIAAVAKRHPGVTFIAAHFGGYTEWEEAAKWLPGLPNVFTDTSSSFFRLGSEGMRRMIALYGTDRVMYGTDYPMWTPADEIAAVRGLGLSEDALESILYGNAARLLGLAQ